MVRFFDGSGPTVTLTVYCNGIFMHTNETELSPDFSFGTSEAPPFDQMTGSSKFTILENGLDPVDQEEGKRTNIWTQSPSTKKRKKTF